MSNLFECKNLTKVYQSGEEKLFALNNVDINLKKEQIITILGPSGSGKTTLLNMLSALDSLDSGSIVFNNSEISKLNEKNKTLYRRNNTGFIFQSYNLISTLTVYENIELGAFISKKPLNIDDVINEVGLNEHKNKYPHQLSGGQQQRVAIARVLVKNPDVIFCDEPTGALDETSGRIVLDLLQKLNKNYKTTIVMVTHNPNIAKMSNHVIYFNSGVITNQKHNTSILNAYEIEWS